MTIRSFFHDRLPVLRWLGHVLVFFAVPLLIVVAGFDRIWEREERERIDQTLTRLDRHLLLIRKRSDTVTYLGEQFDALQRIIRKSSVKQRREVTIRAMRSLHRRFPGLLRMVVFDAQGNRLAPELDTGIGTSISRRLGEVLCGSKPDRRAAFLRHHTVLSAFLGPGVDPEQLAVVTRIKLTDANPASEWRWVSFASGKWGGFCIQIRFVPDWDFVALRDQVRLLQVLRPRGRVLFGLTDLRGQAYAPSDVAVALNRHGRTTQLQHTLPASLVALQQLDTGVFIWASQARKFLGDFDSRRLRLITWVALLFALLCLISARVMLGSTVFVLSIRQRLLLLFAFASGVPLVLILFVQWDALEDLERRRSREATEAMERHLLALDSRYADLRSAMESRLRKLLAMDQYAGIESIHGWRGVLEEVQRSFFPREIILFAPNGHIVLEYQENTDPPWTAGHSQNNASAKLLGNLIRSLCARLDPSEGGAAGEMAVSIAETISGGDLPISDICSNLGKVFELTIFRDQRWFYAQPLRNPRGRIEHVVTVSWKRNLLERMYLQQALPGFERIQPDVRLMAWCPTVAIGPLPANFPLFKPLRAFLAALETRGGTLFGEHVENGRRYLVTGVKSRRMSDHLLVAVRDDHVIRAERASLVRVLVLFTLSLFGISLFLGYILSWRFLRPIGNLTIGIEAIAGRDFKHRLPVEEPDELGRLSMTFNQMMEGLSDLAVGRIVQESLFPKEELAVGEYRVFGQTHAATELGGDYYDVKQLPDDRVLMIIGDVSGHGVGPAMVMAMAKIMVEYCLKDFHLETFCTAFNDALFRVMKRKRMMSCFLGIIDTRRNVLQMVNAGHNFPFLIRQEARLLEDLGNSYPLGSRAIMNPKVVELSIEPGDTLVFYTDGLIETDAGTDQIGYEGLATRLPALVSGSLARSCEQIWDWNREQAVHQQQEDDITILLLQRSKPA